MRSALGARRISQANSLANPAAPPPSILSWRSASSYFGDEGCLSCNPQRAHGFARVTAAHKAPFRDILAASRGRDKPSHMSDGEWLRHNDKRRVALAVSKLPAPWKWEASNNDSDRPISVAAAGSLAPDSDTENDDASVARPRHRNHHRHHHHHHHHHRKRPVLPWPEEVPLPASPLAVPVQPLHRVSAMAASFCELYRIKKDDVALMLELFPDENLRMQLVARQRREAARLRVCYDDASMTRRCTKYTAVVQAACDALVHRKASRQVAMSSSESPPSDVRSTGGDVTATHEAKGPELDESDASSSFSHATNDSTGETKEAEAPGAAAVDDRVVAVVAVSSAPASQSQQPDSHEQLAPARAVSLSSSAARQRVGFKHHEDDDRVSPARATSMSHRAASQQRGRPSRDDVGGAVRRAQTFGGRRATHSSFAETVLMAAKAAKRGDSKALRGRRAVDMAERPPVGLSSATLTRFMSGSGGGVGGAAPRGGEGRTSAEGFGGASAASRAADLGSMKQQLRIGSPPQRRFQAAASRVLQDLADGRQPHDGVQEVEERHEDAARHDAQRSPTHTRSWTVQRQRRALEPSPTKARSSRKPLRSRTAGPGAAQWSARRGRDAPSGLQLAGERWRDERERKRAIQQAISASQAAARETAGSASASGASGAGGQRSRAPASPRNGAAAFADAPPTPASSPSTDSTLARLLTRMHEDLAARLMILEEHARSQSKRLHRLEDAVRSLRARV